MLSSSLPESEEVSETLQLPVAGVDSTSAKFSSQRRSKSRSMSAERQRDLDQIRRRHRSRTVSQPRSPCHSRSRSRSRSRSHNQRSNCALASQPYVVSKSGSSEDTKLDALDSGIGAVIVMDDSLVTTVGAAEDKHKDVHHSDDATSTNTTTSSSGQLQRDKEKEDGDESEKKEDEKMEDTKANVNTKSQQQHVDEISGVNPRDDIVVEELESDLSLPLPQTEDGTEEEEEIKALHSKASKSKSQSKCTLATSSGSQVSATTSRSSAESSSAALQYNVESEDIRMFCQPYSQSELVEFLCATSERKKRFYEALSTRFREDPTWCKLFVHGLPWSLSEATLSAYFSQFGTVREVVILKGKTGQSKGYGFVVFTCVDEAVSAISSGPHQIEGRAVRTDLAWRGRKKKKDEMAAATGGGDAHGGGFGHGPRHGQLDRVPDSGRAVTSAAQPEGGGADGHLMSSAATSSTTTTTTSLGSHSQHGIGDGTAVTGVGTSGSGMGNFMGAAMHGFSSQSHAPRSAMDAMAHGGGAIGGGLHPPHSGVMSSPHFAAFGGVQNHLGRRRVLNASEQMDLSRRRLFIASLSYRTDDETLARAFGQFGELEEAVVIKDKHTGSSRGFGFVIYKQPQSAALALRQPEKTLDGRRVKVSYANSTSAPSGRGLASADLASMPFSHSHSHSHSHVGGSPKTLATSPMGGGGAAVNGTGAIGGGAFIGNPMATASLSGLTPGSLAALHGVSLNPAALGGVSIGATLGRTPLGQLGIGGGAVNPGASAAAALMYRQALLQQQAIAAMSGTGNPLLMAQLLLNSSPTAATIDTSGVSLLGAASQQLARARGSVGAVDRGSRTRDSRDTREDGSGAEMRSRQRDRDGLERRRRRERGRDSDRSKDRYHHSERFRDERRGRGYR